MFVRKQKSEMSVCVVIYKKQFSVFLHSYSISKLPFSLFVGYVVGGYVCVGVWVWVWVGSHFLSGSMYKTISISSSVRLFLVDSLKFFSILPAT